MNEEILDILDRLLDGEYTQSQATKLLESREETAFQDGYEQGARDE